MSDTNLHQLLGSMFSINLVLVPSAKVIETELDLPTAFNRFKQILTLNGSFRDPASNVNITIPSLFVRFRQLNELDFSLNSATMKKLLHEKVSQFDPLKTNAADSCPWFEEWKNTFLANFETCDHEFIGANFGCIFVLTSDELANQREVLAELSSKVKAHQAVRWFQPNFFKFYIVLDTQTSALEADPNVRNQYSELCMLNGQHHCFWLHAEPEVDFKSVQINPPIEMQVQQLNLTNREHPLALSDENTDDSGDFNFELQQQADRKLSAVSIQHNETFLRKLDVLIRDLLNNALLPWSEKQIKLLYEAISLRKGLRRSIFSATKQLLSMSNSVPYRSTAPNNVIYSPDANEMQPRKLADWAMCLRLFDLAAQYYAMAKREFQTDSAWFYYAGACEANALASFHLNRLQKQDFESAISCYLDTCKMPALAIRVALLATDVCRKVWPIDAASMFIRLTEKDHNLKAALFLEQAARCFQNAQPPRKRRATFHFVLAGNRYSRCKLKNHALACLLRHGQTNWDRCMEHVDQTLSRIHLQLTEAQITKEERNQHRLEALRLLRKNAHKETFFNDFVKELTSNTDSLPNDLFHVQIVSCRRVHVHPNEGYSSSSYARSTAHICFVNEVQPISLTLSCAFRISLQKLKILASSESVECEPIDVQLDDSIESTITCLIKPNKSEQFEVYGFEFETNNAVKFTQHFDAKLITKKLQFKSIETLPPLTLNLQVNDRDVDGVELLTGEMIELTINVQSKATFGDWRPAQFSLITNADLQPIVESDVIRVESSPESKDLTKTKVENLNEKKFTLNSFGKTRFRLNGPSTASNHSRFVRLEYSDERDLKRRTVVRPLELYVRECTQVEATSAPNVFSIRNVQSINELRFRLGEQSEVCLQPGLTAFVRLQDDNSRCVRWTSGSRQGHLYLPSVLSSA